MASKSVAEISRSDLKGLETPSTAYITDVKHLASYNWVEKPTPTIAVPGAPALWSAPRGTQRLKQDSGFVYIAQNAARHPDSPLEPLFRALYLTNPSFDIRSTHVVTDRNNLRKLLCFVNPSLEKKGHGRENFTIHVEVVNNTAILSRDETKTTEYISPLEFRGFGHEFERAYTKETLEGSTGHHRVISYHFGGLNLIVRHETDGYVGDTIEKTTASNSQEPQPDGNDLSGLLGSLSLSSTPKAPSIRTGTKLTVREEGHMVPRESTLEIKTRVAHKPLVLNEVAPQLWASQTPKLVRAYHSRGTFQEPRVEDVAADIRRWEEAHQGDLRMLAALLRKLLNVAKESKGPVTVRYDACVGKDRLVVVDKVDGKRMLPQDLYSRWKKGEEAKAATSDQMEAKNSTKLTDNMGDGKKSSKHGVKVQISCS